MSLIKIGDFCMTGSGGTPSRSNESRYYNGDIPWVKSGELKESVIHSTEEKITKAALAESSAKMVPAGSLLVAMYGATIGRVAVLGMQAATNQAVCNIQPDQSIADCRYLYYALRDKAPHWISRGAGGAQPNISQGIIRDTSIFVPPLPEQRRIADILDRADALRAKRRAALARLDELTQAIFIEMFGDPVSNPKGWPTVTLEKIGNLNRGISKHRPRNDPLLLGGTHPLIQTGEVSNCDGYIRSFNATYSDIGLKQSKLWPAGTLCITIAANIAKTGILTFDACFPDSIVGFTNDEPATVEYVRVWLTFLQKTLEDNAPESAQKNINLAILRDLKIPLPPIERQRAFFAALKASETLNMKHQLSDQSFNALFASLQDRAFRGAL